MKPGHTITYPLAVSTLGHLVDGYLMERSREPGFAFSNCPVAQ